MVQWIRIRLPMQGTQVRSLAQEDSMCHRATKPVAATTDDAHSRANEPQLRSPGTTTPEAPKPESQETAPPEACREQLLKPMGLGPVLHNRRSHLREKPRLESCHRRPQAEKAHAQQQRPSAKKNKHIKPLKKNLHPEKHI